MSDSYVFKFSIVEAAAKKLEVPGRLSVPIMAAILGHVGEYQWSNAINLKRKAF